MYNQNLNQIPQRGIQYTLINLKNSSGRACGDVRQLGSKRRVVHISTGRFPPGIIKKINIRKMWTTLIIFILVGLTNPPCWLAFANTSKFRLSPSFHELTLTRITFKPCKRLLYLQFGFQSNLQGKILIRRGCLSCKD